MTRYNLKKFLSDNSIQGTELLSLLEIFKHDNIPMNSDGPWIAGGLIRRTLMNEDIDLKIVDVDVFFHNEKQFDYFESVIKLIYHATLLIENKCQKTYSCLINGKEYHIQLISFKNYDSVEDLLDSFDFTVCQFATDGGNLYCGPYSLWDLANKNLKLHKITYGGDTIKRIMKYSNQGFQADSQLMDNIHAGFRRNPETIFKTSGY